MTDIKKLTMWDDLWILCIGDSLRSYLDVDAKLSSTSNEVILSHVLELIQSVDWLYDLNEEGFSPDATFLSKVYGIYRMVDQASSLDGSLQTVLCSARDSLKDYLYSTGFLTDDSAIILTESKGDIETVKRLYEYRISAFESQLRQITQELSLEQTKKKENQVGGSPDSIKNAEKVTLSLNKQHKKAMNLNDMLNQAADEIIGKMKSKQ